MGKQVHSLLVLSILVLGALPVSSQETGRESTAPGQATAMALDPELTNYQYPFPVRFYEADTQAQKLRMAYMEVDSFQRYFRALLDFIAGS